ncbi:hypothetical protein [Pyrinomonas sp.]
MDDGEERIEDEALVEALRRQARWINRRAMITAAIATLLAIIFS